jgi:hypothetical protein
VLLITWVGTVHSVAEDRGTSDADESYKLGTISRLTRY